MDLSLKIRMLAALAFVPVDDIVESFERLADFMPDKTKPITDYFEDTSPTSVDCNVVTAAVNHTLPMSCGVFTTELEKVFRVQTTPLKDGIVACNLMLPPNILAFGIFLMSFDVKKSLNVVIISQIRAGQPAPPQRGK